MVFLTLPTKPAMRLALFALALVVVTIVLALVFLWLPGRFSNPRPLGAIPARAPAEPDASALYLPVIIQPDILSPPAPPTATLAPSTTPANEATATSIAATTGPGPTPTPTNTPPANVAPTNTPTSTASPPMPTLAASTLLEDFESLPGQWAVLQNTAGGGVIERSNVQAVDGAYAARLSTAAGGSAAWVGIGFSDAAGNHPWNERPGTWVWQRASLYLPASTVAQLGQDEYLTLGGIWSSGAGYGWHLRVRQGGELYVVGQRDWDNTPVEFRVYGKFPQDRWVTIELGLHSQNGPGVKRAFAFLLDGDFYGWYHQGRMQNEVYDRAALGVVSTNSPDQLALYVDDWYEKTSASFPSGPDARSTAAVQEQNYRSQSGVMWQIDWTTWANDLRLDAAYGLFSNSSRLQSGRNLDRLPDLTSGWAEIEIEWPNGTPPKSPSSYFGPMVGFRKEINREENLEIIPIGLGNGQVNLALEAWVNGGPLVLATWPLPTAAVGGTHIPEPGDIIRVRWEQLSPTSLNVRASFYDASSTTWHMDIINHTFNPTNVGGVNFTDGYHQASSVTIDSTMYSIRRFKLGALTTYP